MPEHRPGLDAPARSTLATIERIKRDIASHPNPETLNEIRAAFRREIPLHLRSYAAALLILEATEGKASGRPDNRKGEGRKGSKKPEGQKSSEGRRPNEGKADRGPKDKEQRQAKPEGQGGEPRLDENRPRFTGEGSTIFFGMGKRQRLYPRVLYRILTEEAHLAPEEIGDIRSFDNYSFADVDPLCADTLIGTINGYAFRGRGLPVSRARKRGEEAPEQEDRHEEATEQVDADASEPAFLDEPLEGDDFTDADEGVDETFGEDDEEEQPAH